MKLSETELLDRVISIISEDKGIPAEKIKGGTSFDELGLDSVDAVNITFAIEDEFGIVIPDEGLYGMKNVGQFVAMLSEALDRSP